MNSINLQSSTSDVISTLPSNITENILKCLPLRDVVRTSVLSSSWRYKWVLIPELAFHGKFFHESLRKGRIKTIIYQVLLLHNGPLVKFKLLIPQFKSCPDIDHWILILLKKNVQEFALHLRFEHYHTLPCHLFSFLHLRKLSLACCIFEPPPTFKGFPRLVELVMRNVVLVNENMFGIFISSCPLLEWLTLISCSPFDDLKINARNLKYFVFLGVFKSICFKRTTLLAEICINLSSKQLEEREVSNLIKFFDCLLAIEELTLKEYTLAFLGVGRVPKRLPSTLNCLKILILDLISFFAIGDVSCALCLIRSSPNLQKLKMMAYNHSVDVETIAEFLQAQDFSNLPLNRLRKVEMHLLTGAEPEMQFVKLLLACSPALEKMKIVLEEDNPSTEELGILKKLIRFPRASPKAELILLDG